MIKVNDGVSKLSSAVQELCGTITREIDQLRKDLDVAKAERERIEADNRKLNAKLIHAHTDLALAAEMLSRDPAADDPIALLVRLSRHEETVVREGAARGLGAFQYDQQAKEALLKLARDLQEVVRSAALEELSGLPGYPGSEQG